MDSRECLFLKQNKYFPMSVLPTEKKKDREVLAQELVGPIST